MQRGNAHQEAWQGTGRRCWSQILPLVQTTKEPSVTGSPESEGKAALGQGISSNKLFYDLILAIYE